MNKLILASFFFLLSVFVAKAQYPATSAGAFQQKNLLNFEKSDSIRVLTTPVENVWDHLTIISDSRIDTLLQIHREENQRKNSIDGYWVQVFQGTKEKADKATARILALYPNLKPYPTFPSSYFVVRVDFRTRSEALKFKSQIKSEFNNAFVVEGPIRLPEILKN